MIVSWNWLKEYVDLGVAPEEMTRRWMLAGLNHESTTSVGDDLAIDLEVTSNRPDCLGHLGIAREAAVLLETKLRLPKANADEGAASVEKLTRVTLDCPDLCPRYSARVIRGVRVGASPAWMQRRLSTLGIAAINNVVDITNYVLMECGQPLHAFDFAKLQGSEIVVRRAREGESIEAIDHREYALTSETCVIADASRAVAIGGVMGGAATEVSASTRDVLIEAALFDPASIRHTARRLNLHSDSSYRFERGLDPVGVDWASRRCCELVLEIAGGELAAGVIDVGAPPRPRSPIVLRLAQLPRVLGIEIAPERVASILQALGAELIRQTPSEIEVVPPSWRRDMEREIDLIEEAARVHGYDAIPEDVRVPMAPSARRAQDAALEKARRVLTAAGFDEALTSSAVDQAASEAFSPWTNGAALRSQTPVLRGADCLRRSLIPSLVVALRTNHSLGNYDAALFEIAFGYLSRAGALPEERLLLALASGGDFRALKGVVESLAADLAPDLLLQWGPLGAQASPELFTAAAEARWSGEVVAVVGELGPAGQKRFDLRSAASVAEVCLAPLLARTVLAPQYRRLPAYPAVDRDLNLVVDERIRWADVAATVTRAAGSLLEQLEYRDTYRHAEHLGPGKKSFLFSLRFRDPEGTLTSQAVDQLRDQVVAGCAQSLGAALRA